MHHSGGRSYFDQPRGTGGWSDKGYGWGPDGNSGRRDNRRGGGNGGRYGRGYADGVLESWEKNQNQLEMSKKRNEKRTTAVPKRKQRSERTALENHIPILKEREFDYVLLGTSMFERYSYDRNAKKLWNDNLIDFDIVNLGVGGDAIENILYRIEILDTFAYFKQEPKKVIFLAGANDVENTNLEVMIDGMVKIISHIKTSFPHTKLYLLGMFPRRSMKHPNDKELEARIFKKMTENNTISKLPAIDDYRWIGDRFLGEDNCVDVKYFVDSVHLSREGYEILTSELLKILKQDDNEIGLVSE